VQDTQTVGRTRWRRFAAMAIPAGVVAAGLFAGVAAGIVPISIAISGQSFKVSAERLEGEGFAQYPGVATVKRNGQLQPVAVSVIKDARLYNMCQSVKVLPALPYVLVIRAGGDDAEGNDYAHATNLVIGLDNLQGNATFTTIDIGIDASEAKKGGKPGDLGDFAQQADHITIRDLRQEAYSTQAGTFTLSGLDMRINDDGRECY
jgi:hypothetical protein